MYILCIAICHSQRSTCPWQCMHTLTEAKAPVSFNISTDFPGSSLTAPSLPVQRAGMRLAVLPLAPKAYWALFPTAEPSPSAPA